MRSLSPKTHLLHRIGATIVVAVVGGWAGAAVSQPINFGQPTSGVPLTVQGVSSAFTPPAALGQYVVTVNGDSDLLLQQVRQVEPGAFRRADGNRQVIQAGRFLTVGNAQDRVKTLESRGILSQVDTLSTANPLATPIGGSTVQGSTAIGGTSTVIPLTTAPVGNTALDFTAPSTGTAGSGSYPGFSIAQSEAYYVAIPARPGDLARISSGLVSAGVNPSNVFARNSRLGAFVGVGPYGDRLSAEIMAANLRKAGFSNARVYYN